MCLKKADYHLSEARKLIDNLDMSNLITSISQRSYELDYGKFQGEVIYEKEAVEVVMSTLKPETQIAPHTHRATECFVVVGGTIRVETGHGAATLTVGEVWTTPEGALHSVSSDTGATLLIARIPSTNTTGGGSDGRTNKDDT